MQWKTIDSAPRDGTMILGAHNYSVFTVYWCDDGIQTESGEPGWIDGVFNCYEEYLVYPVTHWMPLPEPPETKD